MTTISGTVYSALSALNTYSAAIDVTSTNIANAESAGYSRQTAVIREKLSADGTGYGVDVSTVKRAYDSFLTAQLRIANQELGKSNVEVETLTSIEQLFSDTGDSGLSAAMSEFWNAWQEVVNDPSGSTARSVLASAADTLADTFNTMSSELSGISTGIEDGINGTVDKIKKLAQQIADANQQLVTMDSSGQNTNTVKDTLDSLALELSSLVNINVSTNDAGQINVQLANGKPLVEGNRTWAEAMATEANSETGLLDVTWLDSDGNATVVTEDISSGELGGYLEVQKELVYDYQQQLDELADEIVYQVNLLHTGGYDLNVNTNIDFFDGTVTGAGGMKVMSSILDDPSTIAAASTSSGGVGDGSKAQTIAELQNSLSTFTANYPDTGESITSSTFSDYYNALVSKIGADVQSAEASYETQSNAQVYYTNACLSVSGVSTDEEMAKLVLYQNAYDAAAKIMTTLDEMMQTLIDM